MELNKYPQLVTLDGLLLRRSTDLKAAMKASRQSGPLVKDAERLRIPHDPLLKAWERVERERPISNKELAGLWKKTPGAVSGYLNGHTPLNVVTQLKFARYLRLPVTAIWPDFEFRDLCAGTLPPHAVVIAHDWLSIKSENDREHFAALIRATASRS